MDIKATVVTTMTKAMAFLRLFQFATNVAAFMISSC
jgi:hypothetical protein